MRNVLKQRIITITVISTVIFVIIYNFTLNSSAKSDKSVDRNWTLNEDHRYQRGVREQLIIGILSGSDNACRRDAIRKTFISKAKAYKALDVSVYFVLDEETPVISAEQEVHNDIVFLNTTITGYNKYFGLKYYLWIKYVLRTFPNVSMIGRVDDDVFACTPQIFDRLFNVRHDMLYYGYTTGGIKMCPTQDCVDEMFIAIGKTLASRVANRTLCLRGKNIIQTVFLYRKEGPLHTSFGDGLEHIKISSW